MWRCDRDESRFTDAQVVAWEYVLPFKHLCILAEDESDAQSLAAYLDKVFSKRALKTAADKIKNEK